MNGMRMVIDDKDEHCLGGSALQSSGSNLLGEPKQESGKRLKTMGAFRGSPSTQRCEEQGDGSKAQGKGNHVLIHSKNNNHDQRTTCHS